jgi:hypothetical protein
VKAREAEVRGLRAYRKALCLIDVGAVFRGSYNATAFCKRRLHILQAHQEPPVLPQEMHQERPLSGQEGEHENPAQEAKQLGRRDSPEPGECTWPISAFVALPEDKACHGGEDPVAGEGLPAGRSGVQLPEAVALWRPAAGQVDTDTSYEHREECECPQSSPPSRGCGQEGRSDDQLS